MSKTLRTAALVVGAVSLAVVTYGAAIGPMAAGAAGSAGLAGLSVSSLGTILGATAGARSTAARLHRRVA